MILAFALLYALAMAVLLGEDLSALKAARLRFEWLIPIGLLFQFVVAAVPSLGRGPVVLAWQLGAMLLVLVMLANRQYLGLKIVAAGVLLNAVVILMNWGMPVAREALLYLGSTDGAALENASMLYVLADEGTYLLILGDIMPIPGPPSLRSVASLGDMLLLVGVVTLVREMMRYPVMHRVGNG